MKTLYILPLFLLAGLLANATQHTIVTSGLNYSPADLTASVGDTVTIQASGNHPTTEVSEATWNANGFTPLAGGFGTQTSSFTFTLSSPGTIYYVCDSHVGAGMKALINVNPVGVEELAAEVDVNFGQLPVRDGMLEYTITSNAHLVKSISIVNINGQEMVSELVEADQGRLELNAPAGIYIVLLEDKNGNLIFRESISVE